jgi:RNA polymerase sigma-70 factor (ECF subfamily)
MGVGPDHPPGGSDESRPTSSDAIDPTLVAALYLNHGHELRRFVLGVVRDPDLAADVVQTTFAKVVEFGPLARAEALKSWLFKVAYHEAITARRRQATRDEGRRKLARLGCRTLEHPEDSLIRGETAERIRKALEELPPEQRRVVWARMYEDKTFAEIAQEFGVPLGTVLTRMRRALVRMRQALGTGE